MAVPAAIAFELLENGKLGRLTQGVRFKSPITGHTAKLEQFFHVPQGTLWVECYLQKDGTLDIADGTMWDYASGPAIDTPAVVIASVAHDMFCHLTNLRMIPWECRAKADKYYRDCLKANGVGMVRRYAHWLAVSTYSQAVARWRDKA